MGNVFPSFGLVLVAVCANACFDDKADGATPSADAGGDGGNNVCEEGERTSDLCFQIDTACYGNGGTAYVCCVNGQWETLYYEKTDITVFNCQCETDGALVTCNSSSDSNTAK